MSTQTEKMSEKKEPGRKSLSDSALENNDLIELMRRSRIMLSSFDVVADLNVLLVTLPNTAVLMAPVSPHRKIYP